MKATKISLLERALAHRERSRVIAWPLADDPENAVRVRVKVLTGPQLEAAYFATEDYFARSRRKVSPESPVWQQREVIERVWRAFEDVETGEPIAPDADTLAGDPDVVHALALEWRALQASVAAPVRQATIDRLVEELKKNSRSDLLDALPWSWLRSLTATLASQLAISTGGSSSG